MKVLLIDDDAELSGLMAEFFVANSIELTPAFSGPDGLRQALTGRFDLVLLDVMLPGFDGFEVLRRLRSESQVPVLMLTARTESHSRILGLDTGADDYLPKPFDPLELLARVRAILRRTRVTASAPPSALHISGVSLDPNSRRVYLGEEPVELTTIEFDILETLMLSAGRVVSRDELAQRLYQRTATPFERAIDVHISHLRKKLETEIDLIRTIRGIGYQFAVAEGRG
jgi:two-component system response regulator CpxR